MCFAYVSLQNVFCNIWFCNDYRHGGLLSVNMSRTGKNVSSNKNALIQLFKADIPFVSQLAATRLISKHNMKGKDINKLKEDAPTNSVAAGGVDMNPTGLSMKKKRELDARTKEYKLHRRKLKMQRERRMKKKEMLKGSFTKGIKENMNNFSREEYIGEDN